SPQWFNTGLHWAYGIDGPSQGHYYVDFESGKLVKSKSAYEHPQPHACFIQGIADDLVNEGGIMDLWVREARLFKYGSGTGSNFEQKHLRAILKACVNCEGSGDDCFDPDKNPVLRREIKAARRSAVADNFIKRVIQFAKQGYKDIEFPIYDTDWDSDAYLTVSGQNSNNSVRVTDEFLKAVEADGDWDLFWRTKPGKIAKTVKARALWEKIGYDACACADPGLQYHTTVNDWHTCPASGPIRASNPCSEYMFLDDTACNLASMNLLAFRDETTRLFDIEGYEHAVRLWTVVLEISVLMAQF